MSDTESDAEQPAADAQSAGSAELSGTDSGSVAAGVRSCVIVDPSSGPLAVEVEDVDSKGAVLKTEATFQANEYIDAALEMSDGRRHSLFAHVVGSGPDGLTLRWLHFDPSEEQKLEDFLAGTFEGINANDADASIRDKTGRKRRTRKVIKPSSAADSEPIEIVEDLDEPKRRTRKVVQPRSRGGEGEGDITPFSDASGAEETEQQDGQKDGRRTRKVVRPRPPADDATADEYAPAEAPTDQGSSAARATVPSGGAGDGETAHDVVLASTDKYEQLRAESRRRKRKRRKETAESGNHTVTKRHNIVGADGRLDVGATIRNKAKKVSASELAARHEQVRVLNMKTIKSLIQDAVAEAIKMLGGQLDEAERRRLLEEAEVQFQERMQQFQAENKGLQAQAETLQAQLERAERLLEEEKKRQIEADQFTVSDAGLVDLEKRFERIMKRAVADGSVSSQLEEELKGVVTRLLDEEREHIAEQARKAQGEAIALLERKVGRLAKSLDETQAERDRAHRQMAAIQASGGAGLQNVMQAGLGDADPDREQKLALLKDVFEQNKSLRDELKKQGVELTTRRRRPPGMEAPSEEAPAEEAPADADADAPSAETPAADPAAAAPEEPADEGEPEEAAVDDDAMDPDDMPWEIGMKAQTDVAGEEDDEDAGPVKKMDAAAAIAGFEPPPLTKKDAGAAAAVSSSDAATDTTGADEGDEADEDAEADEDDPIDPDDMPWEPGMTVSTEPAGDDEDEDAGPVKRISAADAIASFEPPPLKRKSDG